jgi:hypothetical protein
MLWLIGEMWRLGGGNLVVFRVMWWL